MRLGSRIPETTLLIVLVGLIVPASLVACAPGAVKHNNQGNTRFAEGEYEQAITEYQLAQVDASDRAEPYYNASNAYNQLGEVEAAAAQAQQALKTAAPGLAAWMWYNLGNAFFGAEQWAEAIAAYQASLRLKSGDLDAKHNLELALQKLQEQEQQQQREATPTPAGDKANQETTPTPESQPSSEPIEGMTEEQALQLLQALSQDSQTLQEVLQQMLVTPGPSPERDW